MSSRIGTARIPFLHPLREGRGNRDQSFGGTRADDSLVASAPALLGLHQHDLDPERAERATMGKTNDPRRPAGTHAPDLQPCHPYGLFLLNMNERLLGEEEAAA